VADGCRDPEPSVDRRQEPRELRQHGQRMLTVADVGPYVGGSEKYVRYLIAIQKTEDELAVKFNRPIRLVGLRASQHTPRKTLICEADVWAFLFSKHR
jgi:hypothetical protein